MTATLAQPTSVIVYDYPLRSAEDRLVAHYGAGGVLVTTTGPKIKTVVNPNLDLGWVKLRRGDVVVQLAPGGLPHLMTRDMARRRGII